MTALKLIGITSQKCSNSRQTSFQPKNENVIGVLECRVEKPKYTQFEV